MPILTEQQIMRSYFNDIGGFPLDGGEAGERAESAIEVKDYKYSVQHR